MPLGGAYHRQERGLTVAMMSKGAEFTVKLTGKKFCCGVICAADHNSSVLRRYCDQIMSLTVRETPKILSTPPGACRARHNWTARLPYKIREHLNMIGGDQALTWSNGKKADKCCDLKNLHNANPTGSTFVCKSLDTSVLCDPVSRKFRKSSYEGMQNALKSSHLLL